ncbi:MAG: RNA methyltransferase [Proteobacteria bacterium]|nr:RNA methyltransferase [Pseudomonadota bacterium]
MSVIRSRDNARVKAWAKLADDPRERRRQGMALIEGVHLIEAFLGTGGTPVTMIASESGLGRRDVARLVAQAGVEPCVLEDGLFRRISDAEAPSGIAAEIRIPDAAFDPAASAGCVFLEGIQDAGNIGAILRSAAAFGVRDIAYGAGCADPWSPKALRAGMGGHFHLRIAHSADLAADIARFGAGTICTDAHHGEPVDAIDLRGRVGWIFGSEGAGVSGSAAAAASRTAMIRMPGAAESLNVAASAAICFYERARQLSTRGAGG